MAAAARACGRGGRTARPGRGSGGAGSDQLDAIPHQERGTRRAAVLRVMCLALMMVVAAVASLNVALPGIARDTGATQTQLQWIVDAYALAFAALLLPAGAIGDRYGRKPVLATGLVLYGLASGAA